MVENEGVIGVSVMGGLFAVVEYVTEDVSVSCELDLLEVVTGVTLRVWVVVVVWDSVLVDRLEQKEMYHKKNPGLQCVLYSSCID